MGGWDKSLECKNWILAASFPFLIHKTLNMLENLSWGSWVRREWTTEDGVGNWRRKDQDWEQWRAILEEDEIHKRPKLQKKKEKKKEVEKEEK